MRVTALLSWYDEPAPQLAECVAALSKFADHIIAVDGPYAHFPGALKKPASSPEQAETILRTAAGCGIGATIHSPRQPFWGGEVGKRDLIFKLGMAFAEEGDWFLRIDADEILTAPDYAKEQLAQTDKHVAEVTIWERPADEVGRIVDTPDYESPFRCLFRAIPGIRIEQAHFVVTAPVDGRREFLVGPKALPAEPLWDVRIEHRTQLRSLARKRLKAEYSPLINTLEKVGDFPEED